MNSILKLKADGLLKTKGAQPGTNTVYLYANHMVRSPSSIYKTEDYSDLTFDLLLEK